MKKKVFSKLLMGALLVASVSSFTSCKDYDDDINDLRSQINGLNTSLTTTVNDKISAVNTSLTSLENQLAAVKEAYAKADEGLQKAIDDLAAGKANASDVTSLKQEVVDLKTADANLTAAINALKEAQAAVDKAQDGKIADLVTKDATLDQAIAKAQAQADKALESAEKAQTQANANALTLENTNKDLAALQKTVADNLATVNSTINAAVEKLEKSIKANETSISTLANDVAKNYATLTYVNGKFDALEKSDKEINEKIDKVKSDLTESQKAEVEKLQTQITANAKAIQTITEATIPALIEELKEHTIPTEVEKQLSAALPEALKDYMKTDDIKKLVADGDAANKTLIDALTAKVKSDSTTLAAYTDAQIAIAATSLQEYADSVAAKKDELLASNLETAYKAADKKLNDSIDKVAANVATLKGAFEAATNAEDKTSLAGRFAAIEDFFKAEDAVSVENLAAKIKETETFAEAVKEAADEANGEILGMITSINLFAGPHESGHNNQDGTGYDEFDHNLLFTYAIEKANVFPNAEGQKIVDGTIEFTEGKFRSYTDSILVRVSPVDAKLTKNNIALINSKVEDAVANGVVEVVDVKRYVNDNYLTRAVENSGLWVITFKLVEDKIAEKFEAAAFTGENNEDQILYAVAAKNTEENRYVVSEYDLDMDLVPAYHAWDFNVNDLTIAQIHNRYAWTESGPGYSKVQTDDNDTENDVKADKTFRKELTFIEKNLNGNNYGEYYNTNNCRNSYYTDEEGNRVVYDYPGYTYAEMVEGEADDEDANVTNRYRHVNLGEGNYYRNGIDNRHNAAILNAGFNYTDEDGEWAKIDIDFPALTSCKVSTPIAGFYVTLDQDFALESNASEINAWESYIYKNVGYWYVHNGKLDTSRGENGYVKAALQKGSKGSIYVKNANNVKGDIIGFRVYAVNLDGTLYDPDGRAFYVRIGETVDEQKLTFHVLAETQSESNAIQDEVNGKNPIIAYNADEANELPFFNIADDATTEIVWEWADNNPLVRGTNGKYQPGKGQRIYLPGYRYSQPIFKFEYTEDAKVTDETEWSDEPTANTQNVRVTILDATRLLDGETYYLRAIINETDASSVTVRTLNIIDVEVTKVMPTELPSAFKVRTAQENHAKAMDFYLRPHVANNSWQITGWFDADEDGYGWDDFAKKSGSTAFGYRWATDVRPYNFEEIFAGLVEEDGNTKKYDENYVFVFPGCGNYRNDLDGLKEDATSTFQIYGDYFNYTGLKADKSETMTQEPGYYLPNVRYDVIGTYTDKNKLAVKAGYDYQNISFTLDEDGNPVYGAYRVKPQYFDANGRFVTKAEDAAFQAYFNCAIDNVFTPGIGIAIDALTLNGEEVDLEDWTNPNGKSNDEIGLKSDNYIPYGMGFTVVLDSIGVTWVSDKAALTVFSGDEKAFAASYFKTNFGQFTKNYTKGDALTTNGKSYYTDTLAVLNPTVDKNSLFTVKEKEVSTSDTVKWLKIVDIADPFIASATLEQLKADGTLDKKLPLTQKQLEEYFTITVLSTTTPATGGAAQYGIKFTPKTSALDPTKIGQFVITLNSSAKLVHQWGHTTNVSAGNGVPIYYGKPYSTENLSRRTR